MQPPPYPQHFKMAQFKGNQVLLHLVSGFLASLSVKRQIVCDLVSVFISLSPSVWWNHSCWIYKTWPYRTSIEYSPPFSRAAIHKPAFSRCGNYISKPAWPMSLLARNYWICNPAQCGGNQVGKVALGWKDEGLRTLNILCRGRESMLLHHDFQLCSSLAVLLGANVTSGEPYFAHTQFTFLGYRTFWLREWVCNSSAGYKRTKSY